MTNRYVLFAILSLFSFVVIVSGCDKERIVESTEIVRDVEYIELPPDTVTQFDTIVITDSSVVSDTLVIYDTVTIGQIDTVQIFDTIVQTNTIHDTVTVTVTVTVTDTVETFTYVYDTTVVVDTVLTTQCGPNEQFAVSALQYHVDPLVLQFINQEFGLTEGWILYLSAHQHGISKQSSTVYDIQGYIDYWTPDFSGYYVLEYVWRVTHTGGDPAIPQNWQLSDPPAAAASTAPGLRVVTDRVASESRLR